RAIVGEFLVGSPQNTRLVQASQKYWSARRYSSSASARARTCLSQNTCAIPRASRRALACAFLSPPDSGIWMIRGDMEPGRVRPESAARQSLGLGPAGWNVIYDGVPTGVA